jgi:thymidylate synthase
MPDSPVLNFRKEVQVYLRSCDYFLAAASNSSPFSQEELAMITYYVAKVEKILPVLTKT